MVIQSYKIPSEIWVARNLATQKRQISAPFWTTLTTSWLDCEYLRNAIRHRQSENGVANYGHSRTG